MDDLMDSLEAKYNNAESNTQLPKKERHVKPRLKSKPNKKDSVNDSEAEFSFSELKKEWEYWKKRSLKHENKNWHMELQIKELESKVKKLEESKSVEGEKLTYSQLRRKLNFKEFKYKNCHAAGTRARKKLMYFSDKANCHIKAIWKMLLDFTEKVSKAGMLTREEMWNLCKEHSNFRSFYFGKRKGDPNIPLLLINLLPTSKDIPIKRIPKLISKPIEKVPSLEEMKQILFNDSEAFRVRKCVNRELLTEEFSDVEDFIENYEEIDENYYNIQNSDTIIERTESKKFCSQEQLHVVGEFNPLINSKSNRESSLSFLPVISQPKSGYGEGSNSSSQNQMYGMQTNILPEYLGPTSELNSDDLQNLSCIGQPTDIIKSTEVSTKNSGRALNHIEKLSHDKISRPNWILDEHFAPISPIPPTPPDSKNEDELNASKNGNDFYVTTATESLTHSLENHDQNLPDSKSCGRSDKWLNNGNQKLKFIVSKPVQLSIDPKNYNMHCAFKDDKIPFSTDELHESTTSQNEARTSFDNPQLLLPNEKKISRKLLNFFYDSEEDALNTIYSTSSGYDSADTLASHAHNQLDGCVLEKEVVAESDIDDSLLNCTSSTSDPLVLSNSFRTESTLVYKDYEDLSMTLTASIPVVNLSDNDEDADMVDTESWNLRNGGGSKTKTLESLALDVKINDDSSSDFEPMPKEFQSNISSEHSTVMVEKGVNIVGEKSLYSSGQNSKNLVASNFQHLPTDKNQTPNKYADNIQPAFSDKIENKQSVKRKREGNGSGLNHECEADTLPLLPLKKAKFSLCEEKLIKKKEDKLGTKEILRPSTSASLPNKSISKLVAKVNCPPKEKLSSENCNQKQNLSTSCSTTIVPVRVRGRTLQSRTVLLKGPSQQKYVENLDIDKSVEQKLDGNCMTEDNLYDCNRSKKVQKAHTKKAVFHQNKLDSRKIGKKLDIEDTSSSGESFAMRSTLTPVNISNITIRNCFVSLERLNVLGKSNTIGKLSDCYSHAKDLGVSSRKKLSLQDLQKKGRIISATSAEDGVCDKKSAAVNLLVGKTTNFKENRESVMFYANTSSDSELVSTMNEKVSLDNAAMERTNKTFKSFNSVKPNSNIKISETSKNSIICSPNSRTKESQGKQRKVQKDYAIQITAEGRIEFEYITDTCISSAAAVAESDTKHDSNDSELENIKSVKKTLKDFDYLKPTQLKQASLSLHKVLKCLPDTCEVLFHVFTYLSKSKINTMPYFYDTGDYSVMLPSSESCIVTVLMEMDENADGHLKDLLKTAMGALHHLIISKKKISAYGLAAFCRVFTAICKRRGDKLLPLLLCKDLLKMKHMHAPFLIASIAGVWKQVFQDLDSCSPEELILQSAIAFGAQQRTVKSCDSTWYGSSRLLGECLTAPVVPDINKGIRKLMIKIKRKCNEGLWKDCYILSSALVIFAAYQDREWTKIHVLENFVLPYLKKSSLEKLRKQKFVLFCELYVDISLLNTGNADLDLVLKNFIEKEIKSGDSFVQDAASYSLMRLLLQKGKLLPPYLTSWFKMKLACDEAQMKLTENWLQMRAASERHVVSRKDIYCRLCTR